MTREHFFPRWLIDHADARRDGIAWLGKERLNPENATVPLCGECNNAFANALEGPVSNILRAVEAGGSLSDLDAELLVRWMWKFEGLQWALFATSEQSYTMKYSLCDRVTKPYAFAEVRHRMLLAMATCHANDPGFTDWPLGLDTPVGEDAVTMSGVFGRVAILTSFLDFADQIPDVFGKYAFGAMPPDRNAKVFSPPCAFPVAQGAIATTQATALGLSIAHRELGRRMRAAGAPGPSAIIPVRSRVELPPT
jgi:hypothetical protein